MAQCLRIRITPACNTFSLIMRGTDTFSPNKYFLLLRRGTVVRIGAFCPRDTRQINQSSTTFNIASLWATRTITIFEQNLAV
jgi:hypothetical protein